MSRKSGKENCRRCRWYVPVNTMTSAGVKLKHSCALHTFWPMDSDPSAGMPSSGLKDGLIVYADEHLESFWKKRAWCYRKHEWVLFRLLPVLIAGVALLVSILSLVVPVLQDDKESQVRCYCHGGVESSIQKVQARPERAD